MKRAQRAYVSGNNIIKLYDIFFVPLASVGLAVCFSNIAVHNSKHEHNFDGEVDPYIFVRVSGVRPTHR